MDTVAQGSPTSFPRGPYSVLLAWPGTWYILYHHSVRGPPTPPDILSKRSVKGVAESVGHKETAGCQLNPILHIKFICHENFSPCDQQQLHDVLVSD